MPIPAPEHAPSPSPPGRPPTARARSLVVPMYQEARRIAATVAALDAARELLGDVEILFVDDGSSDGTGGVVRAELEQRPELVARLIELPANRGKGGAIAAGIAESTGRVVAFADADLSTPPPAIAACLQAIEDGDADVVVTTRHAPESRITGSAPAARRASTSAFQRLLDWRLGLGRYSDTQCGLKGFTGDAARTLFADLSVQRFAFDVEVLLRAEVAGYRIMELPIEWHHVDDSTVRPVRDGARMALDVLRLRGRVRRWRRPDDVLPVLAVLERRHWWYVSQRDVASDAIGRHGRARRVAVDVAASTGSLVDRLGELGFATRVGLDPSVGALRHASGPASDPATLIASTSDCTALRSGSADVVAALDTLAFATDDVAALGELARLLRPGGIVVVTAPAMPRLWSDYDVALGHRRRYGRELLADRMRSAGLEPVRISHVHAWMTPLTLLLQRTVLGRFLLQKPEHATFVDARINRLLRAIVAVERLLLRRIDLPFGPTILGVARRPS